MHLFLTFTNNSSVFIVATSGIAKSIIGTVQQGFIKDTAAYILQENRTTPLAKEGIPRSSTCTCQK